eukprot:746335-Pelagomonas_calceolata.AAC.1
MSQLLKYGHGQKRACRAQTRISKEVPSSDDIRLIRLCVHQVQLLSYAKASTVHIPRSLFLKSTTNFLMTAAQKDYNE